MRHFWLAIVPFCLTACGVADVGISAATTAKMQAEQAKQGKETMDRLQRDLDAASKAQAAQLAEAEKRNSQ